jgi:chemotaxis protein CheC
MAEEDIELFDQKLHGLLVMMANDGFHNAARGISTMVGEDLRVLEPSVRLIPVLEIPTLMGGPENEAVGIYLRAEGRLTGQIMLIIPLERALELCDMLLGEAPGTTQYLDRLERSALAELGNLTGTFFLNSVAKITNLDIRPTPPAVMVDMVGAILDIILATSAGLSENVLMLQATFVIKNREARVDFWVIPDRETLQAINDSQGN